MFYISGSFDFFAVNHYSSIFCSPASDTDSYPLNFFKDSKVKQEIDPRLPAAASEWIRVSNIEKNLPKYYFLFVRAYYTRM